MKSQNLKVLIVDDEPKTVDLIKLYLEHEGYTTEPAYDGLEALRKIRAWQPDLVILDVMLPELDGLAVCNALRNQSDLPVIMLTARVRSADKVAGLELGADDYITKPFDPKELVARVKAVLRRTTDKNERGPRELRRGRLLMNYLKHETWLGGKSLYLRPLEFELLWMLAGEPRRVFSRNELIEKILGYEFEGSSRVMDVHVLNLRRKIEVDPANPQFIQTVYGVGYKFMEDGVVS